MIPLCTPDIRGKEQEYAADAISSGYLCDGPYLERFADALCDWTGRKHCVLTSSGTAALHTALALRNKTWQKIRVPNWTFVASANSAKLAGFGVLLYDRGVSMAYSSEVMAVDILGHKDNEWGTPAVRDSCQSISHQWHFRGETCPQAVSFNANKMVCAAGGGALFLDDVEQYELACEFVSQARVPGVYDHKRPATNYRMSNVQAAIGLAQMETLPQRIGKKKWIHGQYTDAGCVPYSNPGAFLYAMTHPEAKSIYDVLNRSGIGASRMWVPLSRTQAYEDADCILNGYADEMYRTTLALPCSTWMGDDEISKCAESVSSVLGEFS